MWHSCAEHVVFVVHAVHGVVDAGGVVCSGALLGLCGARSSRRRCRGYVLLWSMVERLPYWAVSRQTGVCGGRYTTRIVGDTTDIAQISDIFQARMSRVSNVSRCPAKAWAKGARLPDDRIAD